MWKSFTTAIRSALSSPEIRTAAVLFLLLAVAIGGLGIGFGLYDRDGWMNVLVEAHGALIDLAFLSIIGAFVIERQRRRETAPTGDLLCVRLMGFADSLLYELLPSNLWNRQKYVFGEHFALTSFLHHGGGISDTDLIVHHIHDFGDYIEDPELLQAKLTERRELLLKCQQALMPTMLLVVANPHSALDAPVVKATLALDKAITDALGHEKYDVSSIVDRGYPDVRVFEDGVIECAIELARLVAQVAVPKPFDDD